MRTLEQHPLIMVVVGVLGISMSAIFVKYSTAPSVITACWRLLWTVLLMTPAVLGRGSVRAELRRTPPRLLALCAASGVCLAAHFVLWFESLQKTSVASSTAIVCTEVIWVALGWCLFLRGRLSRKAAGCIALTLAGSLLIALADSGTGGSHLYGDLLALAAAVAVAVYTLIGRTVRRTASTTVYTYVVYLASAVTLAALALVQGLDPLGYGRDPLVVGLLLAVFSTILGHSIFSWCLKYFSPAFVSASKLCEPVVASLLAVPLFGEVPSVPQLLGGAVVLGGVLLYSRVEQAENG